MRSSLLGLASFVALSGISCAAGAAGLGKIVVYSALGQPLRAEIVVSATREEFTDMKAQLASQEAFKQAGLDYATSLLSIRFNLEKRPDGQAIIKLSSDRPINDPFVDMLLELNWASGRLVREYTFLLDPPEVAAKAGTGSGAAGTRPVARVSEAGSTGGQSGKSSDLRSNGGEKPSGKPKVDSEATGQATEREVRRGDTLHRIATETRHAGVSVEQMLVGLFKANQDAFEGGNMNRLRTGKILSVPQKSEIAAIPPDDARKLVTAQSSDWNAYRNRLAGLVAKSPVRDEAAKQEVAGKISVKVEEKVAPAADVKDQLKVSKTVTTEAKSSGASGKSSEEDLIAKEKALKETNERVAMLEKNLVELQKLIELKNQSLAELQKQAAGQQASPAKGSGDEPPKSASTSSGAMSDAAPMAPSTTDSTTGLAAEEKAGGGTTDQSAQAPTVAEPKSVEPPKAKPAVASPPLPEGPSFAEELLQNPVTLAAGGGILALLAAYFLARRRRLNKQHAPVSESDSSTLSPESSSLISNSVFRSTGGQSVDTSSQTPAQTDFSQAGPGSIDTDEVDPVAEADVYMAYGRDVQAEEILLEAKVKDPRRYAIPLKLLEIYSNRKDVKKFETLATELYGETGGVGPDWAKAVLLGAALDPSNPLFGAKTASDVSEDIIRPVLPVGFGSEESPDNGEPSPRVGLLEISEMVGADGAAPEAELSVESNDGERAASTDFEFDLEFVSGAEENNLSGDEGIPVAPPAVAPETATLEAGAALDFDLSFDAESELLANPSASKQKIEDVSSFNFSMPELESDALPASPVVEEVPTIEFDLGAVQSASDSSDMHPANAEPVNEADLANEPGPEEVEFDVNLNESAFLAKSPAETPAFDMTSIDLDLSVPESGSEMEHEKQVLIDENPGMPLGRTDEESDEWLSPSSAPEVAVPDLTFDDFQVSTAVNPDFEIDGEDVGDDQTLISQSETIVNPMLLETEDMMAPDFDMPVNEEVATKLELANAYEEMGDLEGARELLQEVLKEGDAPQREKAQAILSRIGE